MLPIDLVLVRHGQSEGNAAKRRSEAGDHSIYTPEFRDRHSRSFRLTDKGRRQASLAGDWLINNFWGKDGGFDRYYVSEYIRAMETAGRLNLPGALWYPEPYLTERDWGMLDILPEHERREKFATELHMREIEPYFWRPPNGESFMDLCLRIDRVLQTYHRECSDMRVCAVCHGEVMRAFQCRIERLSQERFRELIFTENMYEKIYNCQIIHYTRRDPETNKLGKYANWVRHVRVTAERTWVSDWTRFERPKYSNDDLLELAERAPAFIH